MARTFAATSLRRRSPRAVPLGAIALAILASACGPSTRGGDDEGGGDVDASTTVVGEPATLTGRVWAPGQAPGQVPPGHEIPVFDAVVYLTQVPPPEIPQRVHCEPCIEVPASAQRTSHDGSFTLDVSSGDYWLVIQKAQFRLVQRLAVAPGATALGDAATTLPSRHDPLAGAWIPRIAVAAGGYDPLETILGKMGLGQVDASGVYSAHDGEVALWANGGNDLGMAVGSLTDLARDLDSLRQYHVVFIPCASDDNTAALRDPQVLRNLRDYVKEGGKLYVTDWSGEWMDNVFPAQVQLGSGAFGGFGAIDTPASAYDRASDSWSTGQFGNADGDAYDSPDGQVVDGNLRAWLHGQLAPQPHDGTPAMVNADDFDVVDNWNWIQSLTTVDIGLDDQGQPVSDVPRSWVIGSREGPFGGTTGDKNPLTVTFEPAGCGRVLYSTYHTTPGAHLGLIPQERILLYLIMEIGVCKAGPIVVE
ncbi:MAG: hypothetical protein KA190_18380 [Kofleriaceae bacterium]|nr:hypothetical protein [Kofleriaceae bacterium]